MRNINFPKFFFIAMCIFLVCLSISKIFSVIWDISADYLSSATTLIAAFIAYILFDDWKSEFKTGMFDRLKDRLFKLFGNVEDSLEACFEHNSAFEKDLISVTELGINLLKAIDNLIQELQHYEVLIKKYGYDVELKVTPEKIIKILLEISNDVPVILGYDHKNQKKVDQKSNFSKIASSYLLVKVLRRDLISDIQQIILDSLDDKKGQ